MKKYDLRLNLFVEKEYKGIEAESRDDAEAIAIQMFKEQEYSNIDVNESEAFFIREYS